MHGCLFCLCNGCLDGAPGAFGAGEDVFTISTSYKSLLSNPEQNGMLDRLMKEAFRRIGLRAEIVFAPTETELFTMLQKDRIDVALYDKLTGYEQLSLRGFTDIRHLEPPLVSKDMFLYLNKKHEGLAEPLAKTLREMKQDGTYERIVKEATSNLMMDKK